MAEGNGVLVVWTDIPAEIEEEFNVWYNTEHIPQLLREVPGFLAGRRYVSVMGKPKYVTIYDLADEKVDVNDAFLKVRQNRTPWTLRMVPKMQNLKTGFFKKIFAHGNRPDHDAEFILTVRLNTPADHEKDFNTWYNEDHVPALSSVKGVYCGRRYQINEGDPKYLAVYEMNDPNIVKNADWKAASDYGRTKEIFPYLKDLHTVVARRIFPE
jgi:hypothetical protein